MASEWAVVQQKLVQTGVVQKQWEKVIVCVESYKNCCSVFDQKEEKLKHDEYLYFQSRGQKEYI